MVEWCGWWQVGSLSPPVVVVKHGRNGSTVITDQEGARSLGLGSVPGQVETVGWQAWADLQCVWWRGDFLG